MEMEMHLQAIAALNNTVQQLKQEQNPNVRVMVRSKLLGMLEAFALTKTINSTERMEYLLIVSESVEKDY